MLVCNCNGISEREVKDAVSSGVQRWHDVHAYYDCEPNCGKCECEIADTIADHRDAVEPVSFFGDEAFAGAR